MRSKRSLRIAGRPFVPSGLPPRPARRPACPSSRSDAATLAVAYFLLKTSTMTRSRAIEIVAPSGYPPDQAAVERGLARLRAAGHRVMGDEVAQRRFLRFGGTDAQRAGDLNRLADPSHPLPDIVLALRGSYGAVRILDSLDYAGIARRLAGAPVALCGHSDFTAIQLALFARAGLITFGGP